MRKPNNNTDDEENVAHQGESQRHDDATYQYQQLYRSRFGLLRKQDKSALKKRYNRTD